MSRPPVCLRTVPAWQQTLCLRSPSLSAQQCHTFTLQLNHAQCFLPVAVARAQRTRTRPLPPPYLPPPRPPAAAGAASGTEAIAASYPALSYCSPTALLEAARLRVPMHTQGKGPLGSGQTLSLFYAKSKLQAGAFCPQNRQGSYGAGSLTRYSIRLALMRPGRWP